MTTLEKLIEDLNKKITEIQTELKTDITNIQKEIEIDLKDIYSDVMVERKKFLDIFEKIKVLIDCYKKHGCPFCKEGKDWTSVEKSAHHLYSRDFQCKKCKGVIPIGKVGDLFFEEVIKLFEK